MLTRRVFSTLLSQTTSASSLSRASLLPKHSPATFPNITQASCCDRVVKVSFVQEPDQQAAQQLELRFHGEWLRDNCSCSRCIEPSSGQKVAIACMRSPAASTVQAVSTDGKTVQVKFGDGHTGTFSSHWLRQYSYDEPAREMRQRVARGYRSVWTRATWDGQGLPSLTYDAVLETEAGLYEWLCLLERYGIVVLRNSGSEDRQVAKAAERIGELQRTIYGELWDVVVEKDPVNLAYTSIELPSHSDLLYYEAPPGIQFLHFRETAANGGANRFVDGAAVLRKMEQEYPQESELLKRGSLSFQYRSPNHWLTRHRPALDVDPVCGELVALNVSPPFEGPQTVDSFDEMPALMEASATLQRVAAFDDELAYDVRFSTGDMVTFNNRRVLHARRAIDESSGRRALQGTYVESDLFWSKLRVMRAERNPDDVTVVGAFGSAHM